MVRELEYILNKYSLSTAQRMPIEIPDTGRATLAALFAELGYKAGAEIGTAEGRFAEVLCNANPAACLYCVDAWETYDGYRDYTDQNKVSGMLDAAKIRLQGKNINFIHEYSMDAVKDFLDASLDFVYIDANHEWPYITQDIYYWARKVRIGGIVAGHDFYRSTRRDSKCHVKHAVIGYCNAFAIHPWFILGTQAKTPGLIRDNSRSWFWVRQW